ncbi:hypothetical protein C1X21_18270 [Pseudomonas sp. FW305-3-2-15-A-LB2]|uniref:Uncharacterized protein n=1 Tax=Pseudomonas extremorientalis TaxID=169669 RepID=A0A1S2TR16_9PSED|nr:hypothetical protein F7R08_14325 [Pseudomonas extremorientalis]PMV18430.1 hypothetical protein C1X22_29640 [Pseudomonas sp. DP16D-L5]PMV22061.1 hypothetical protein C1X17_16155 [Pseudomonas sp. FW305-3-2-15-C-TSA2]PMV37669.1 hypothetical protein C1X21_18270 [Pseudomonas sp. FW305-3-2-15-A-LB2]PMV39793.1 hypothetical protein C1X16_26905 [Pseudomonas sp. FW305-3-2-15-C-R2A1]PMV47881.1 hypothetical protein C1X18_20550 [Pseudomonas sp. FW305-3-2-15-C-LB1]PMV52801.1 hypothetical protein C1X19_2
MAGLTYWIRFLASLSYKALGFFPCTMVKQRCPSKAQTVLPSVRGFKLMPMVAERLYTANHREL